MSNDEIDEHTDVLSIGEKRVSRAASSTPKAESLFPSYKSIPRLDVMITCFLRKKVTEILGMSEEPPYFQLVAYRQEKKSALASGLPQTSFIAQSEDSESKGFCWRENARTEVTLGKETVSEV